MTGGGNAPLEAAVRPPSASPTPAATASPADDALAVARTGLNLQPGLEDDGWARPPPVRLDDGSQVQLYKDGEALHAALEAIRNARRCIYLEVYIFANDDTGQAFKEALAEKAREGVAVYLIYDDFGSLTTPRRSFLRLRDAGVRIRVFHPLRPWECKFSWRPFNRDHRKLLVIDNEIAGLGGLNIGREYAGSWVAAGLRKLRQPLPEKYRIRPDEFFRDTAVGIRGPSARVLANAFARTWNYLSHGGRIARAMTLYPPPTGGRRPVALTVPVRGRRLACIASVPTLDSPLRPTLHRLFAEARRSIHLTMAYFAPDDDLIRELCRAARRGVQVELMLPARTDVPLLVPAARSFYETLLQAGVRIYERQGAILHAKTMVIDGRISVIGSTNLDYRSIEYNLELSAVITSEELGQQMVSLFEHDVRFARRISPAQWRRRPTRDRLVQWAVSRARYLL
ncbi:MAG: phospholipase D-like domain-containing protein [Tepidisphaerales bacterium]